MLTPRAQILIVTSVFAYCSLDKQANELKSGKLYKRFSSHFPQQRPRAGIIKLEWWVEAYFSKKLEVRDDLTVIRTPKLFA